MRRRPRRQRDAEPQCLDQDHVRRHERRRYHDHDECRARDDPPAPLQSDRHATGVVARPLPFFPHPAEQKDFVIHAEAEQHAEHDDGE